MTIQRVKTQKDQTKYTGFEDLLRTFTEADPSRTAILYEKSGKPASLSRAEFAHAAAARAGELLGRPEGAGLCVNADNRTPSCLGILCDGSLSCVLTIFASALAGLQTVLLDENAAEDLLIEQIRQTDIDCLWGSDEDLVEELQPYLTEGIDQSSSLTEDERLPRSHRILFFTSGTTSSSKAVVLTDRSLMAAAYNGSCKLPLSEEDTLLCMLPLNHVFGFVCGLLWGMQCGSAVALGRGARYYTQDLSFYRPTALSAVPMLLGFLLAHDLMNEELRLVLVGAGDCPKALLAAAAHKGVSVSFGYGLTETSSGVAISVPPAYRASSTGTPDEPDGPPDEPDGPSSGPAASFDPYALEICPENTVTLAEDGEILVAGDSCMMEGYYKHPEDTAAVLRDGILYTGDLGRWDDSGRLHIIGRKKEILVLQDGTKIFLPEYEARIAAALPGRDFAVITQSGRPALLLVDPDISLLPANNPAKEAAQTDLQGKLRNVMAGLPWGQQLSAILFTDRPLPRTATGKIKRWELRY